MEVSKDIYFPQALWRHIKRTYLDIGVDSKYYLRGVNKELMVELKHFFMFRELCTFSLSASTARRYTRLRHMSLDRARVLSLEWRCLHD